MTKEEIIRITQPDAERVLVMRGQKDKVVAIYRENDVEILRTEIKKEDLLSVWMKEPEQQHEAWCASLTQLLLINPPKPAPCNCKTKITEPEQVADAMLKEKNQ